MTIEESDDFLKAESHREVFSQSFREKLKATQHNYASLREVARWAYDNGYTPPFLSRDQHKALAEPYA